MSLSDSLQRLMGKAADNPGLGPPDSPSSTCPDEAEILIYLEGSTSPRRRAVLESHFADCDDCRQLLALFVKVPDEKLEGYDYGLAPLSEDAVRKQAARVFAFIENDERRHRHSESKQPAHTQVGRKREGIFIPLPLLAMIVCAICAGVLLWLSIDQRPQDGMDALKLAVKNERRTPARVSGGLEYSPYAATRGEEDNEELQFERALDKLKYAKSEDAPVEARLALARVYLALGKPEEAKNALAILEQLVADGNRSSEILNDLGVAHLHLEHYGEAIANFTKALEVSPGYLEALFNRALAYEHDNRVDEAKQDWQQFIRLSSDEKWKAEAERHLGMLESSSELIGN